jgi:hypothetical protein
MANGIELVESTALQKWPYEDGLNRSVIALTGNADQIDVEAMIGLARERHVVQITVSRGEWRSVLRSQGSAVFSITQESPEFGFSDADVIDALLLAASADVFDIAAYLALLSDNLAEVQIELTNSPSATGYQWYRTTSALERDLTSASWLVVVTNLCSQEGHRRLIVHDANGSLISAPGLVIHGPDGDPAAPTPTYSEAIEKYREQRLSGDLAHVPTPRDLAPHATQGLRRISTLLNGIAEQLVWLWVAKGAWITEDGLYVRFDGARVVEGDLTIEPMESVNEALALWDWATQTTDPARSEALLRCISLVITVPDELRGSGRQILSNATSVLEIMMRTQIAEAMAARSAARDAAFSAARSASDDARSAAAKTFDRVVVQAAAVIALLLANEQHALGASTTKVLLLVIAALLVILGFVVMVIDFPGARSGLAAFRSDLNLYRDHLTRADVDDVNNMQSLRDATTAIFKAQLLAIVLLAAAVGADLYAYFRVK